MRAFAVSIIRGSRIDVDDKLSAGNENGAFAVNRLVFSAYSEMGKGKNTPNQKLRTKGNVKPSSSDRSTEFLQRNVFSGVGATPAFGFIYSQSNVQPPMSSHTSAGGFSSLLPLDQDPTAATLDTDFLAALRRLEKRNSATKQKALDTLITLLHDQNEDGEYEKSEDVVVASVLPFWPRLYNSLTHDEDRRVRELSQVVMHALAKRLGRKLGPCLKEVAVSWTFATVDSYENTARAAQIGLNNTFPGHRRGELYRTYAKYLLDECERRLAYLTADLPGYLKFKKSICLDDPLPPEAHHHLNIATQFLSWVTSLLPELCQLPADSVHLAQLQNILLRLLPIVSPILDMVKFAPLSTAYFRLISAACKSMTGWLSGQEELLDFVILKCVKEVDAFPEKLAAASTCLEVFGEKVWRRVSWPDLVDNTIIPVIEQVQTKTQRQAVYTNLLPLVSQFPLEQIDGEVVKLMERLVDASRRGLVRSLNLPADVDLRRADALPNLLDQGSSVDCLAGLLELSRYLLDRAALADSQELIDFLFERIFCDLLVFVFSYPDSMRRWIYREQFSACLFKQACTDSTGIPESWCQKWLREILTFIQPTFGEAKDSAQRWLLTFSLIGQVDSDQSVENPLNLLITSIIPAFDGEVFKWTASMSRGLAKCSLAPISPESWLSASEETRRNFVQGPIKHLIVDSSREKLPVLQPLVDTLTANIDTAPSIMLELANVIFSASCSYDKISEHMLMAVCVEIAKRDHVSDEVYEFLSSFIALLISNCKLSLTGSSDLINQYVRLTLDELWLLKHSEKMLAHVGGEIVAYLKTREDSEARLFSQQIWINVLAKLKSNGCPSDSAALLAFLRQLPINTDVCQEVWLKHIVSAMSQLSDEVELGCQNLPIFVRSEVFPMHLLPQVAPIIVALQIGLKLDLHATFTASLPAHKQLADLLLILHFWLSAGTVEPYTLDDLSPNIIFMPTIAEEPPSTTNLLSYLDAMCGQFADSVYSLEEFDTSNAALRAALAKRLVDIHPLQWPLSIRQAASCSPPSSWLQEQIIESSSEVFLHLCDVCLPVGVLGRCLPRSVVIAHVLDLSSKEPLEGNREGLARLTELIASLCSTAFVGCSYAFSLASLTLEETVRDSLVDVETSEEPELLRAVIASMKTLQVLVLLRQPVGPIEDHPHLGLAVLSQRLRQLKPRLTREQWDSLLCLTTSWITQAVVRPVQPIAFSVRAFQLVAAIGALFVNSLCSSTTVTGALIRCDGAESTSVDQLMDMNREEWDETDFDFAEDYDCEDDGNVSSVNMRVLEEAEEDDFVDADTEELRFEDPNAQRRLPPPASVQKDWREFFAVNIYDSLIGLTADTCLSANSGVNGHVSKDTPQHLSALCAAVATCSVESLLTCLEQQPDIVVTYLLDTPTHQPCHPPQVENNLFSSECLLAPQTRNSIDLTIRLLTSSPYQASQLLGHVLLTRLVASRSLEPVQRMSDVLIPHLPVSWVSALTAPLAEDLENILSDAGTAVSQWGRGVFAIKQLLGEDVLRGHQRLLAYLLAWDAVVSLLSSASQQSRAGLQAALLKDDMWIGHMCRLILTLGLLLPKQSEIGSLLTVPCRLEPDPRLLLTSSARTAMSSASPSSPQKVESVFAPVDPLVHLPGHRLTEDLSHLAIRLLRRLLSESPALMRSLYAELQRGTTMGERITAGQARQLASHLERVIRRQFSANLIVAEVESIERRASEFKRRLGTTPYLDADLPSAGSVDIKGRPLSREVITTYHFSADQCLEMIISLPENFPLSPVTVDTGHKTGPAVSNWRTWIVHLSVFLNNQNGSILDGIGLWLRNMKKKFDGVEDCAICYSVIHDRNFSFPRLQCRMCKKRFHNECMYRYFQTSRNPTCPLCRSLFYATIPDLPGDLVLAKVDLEHKGGAVQREPTSSFPLDASGATTYRRSPPADVDPTRIAFGVNSTSVAHDKKEGK
ncbi:RING finger protein [Echinococcus granulosus]|uniref:E3 ubiquitin-protein ligase listerin n=1 Tax=Echinococcus granulosus TaxID=6210 RepID=W6ULE7_ECHGR|nr:RING finger protein [Echinococcus granulosus]EUB62345.1 RING finger protein [Echinococcus granulosus]